MRASKPPDAPVVALDLGQVRTGIAISDAGGTLARPLAVVGGEDLDGFLEKLIREAGVGEIVVGVPRTLGGELGPQARRVLEELERLRDKFPAVRFAEWDERLTTRLAVAGTRAGGRGRKKGKKAVDDVAAATMLQEYLLARGGV